jgi:hypothetical protein
MVHSSDPYPFYLTPNYTLTTRNRVGEGECRSCCLGDAAYGGNFKPRVIGNSSFHRVRARAPFGRRLES